MRSTLFLALTLGVFIVQPSPARTQMVVEPGLPEAEALERAYGETTEDIDALMFGGVEPVLDLLERSTGDIRELRERLEAGGEPVPFEEVVQTLERVNEHFQRIANVAPGVLEERLRALRDLEAIQNEIGAHIGDLEASARALAERSKVLNREIELLAGNEHEIAMRRIDIGANERVMRAYRVAITNWELFEVRHARALEVIGEQDRNVELLLHALAANARVYGAATDAARLTREVQGVLGELDQLTELGGVVDDLVRSWDDLDVIMEELRLEFQQVPSF